ncbi:response regulator [Spirochaeta cellobiosiphila]|uniref:response regulator n=1 Tax=Spirochaeta cellobiosiphila TaxID=504483 RepID=UPI000425E349|nr:response regulator [Spirochaeta cellobiosiphila]
MSIKDILYAEDEFTNRKLLQIQFEKNDLQCDLARDGREALDLATSNQYKMIILDQYMPGLNGDEVARTIRQTDPNIPLIAITSDDMEIENLRKAGFNEVFIKPLRGTGHIDKIKEYINKV